MKRCGQQLSVLWVTLALLWPALPSLHARGQVLGEVLLRADRFPLAPAPTEPVPPTLKKVESDSGEKQTAATCGSEIHQDHFRLFPTLIFAGSLPMFCEHAPGHLAVSRLHNRGPPAA